MTRAAVRVVEAAVRCLMPEQRGDDESLSAHMLENAVLTDASRSATEMPRSGRVRDVLIGDAIRAEGMRDAIQDIRASMLVD